MRYAIGKPGADRVRGVIDDVHDTGHVDAQLDPGEVAVALDESFSLVPGMRISADGARVVVGEEG